MNTEEIILEQGMEDYYEKKEARADLEAKYMEETEIER